MTEQQQGRREIEIERQRETERETERERERVLYVRRIKMLELSNNLI